MPTRPIFGEGRSGIEKQATQLFRSTGVMGTACQEGILATRETRPGCGIATRNNTIVYWFGRESGRVILPVIPDLGCLTSLKRNAIRILLHT